MDRGEKAGKWNRHDGRCQKDADDSVKCQTVMTVEQVIDSFGQTDDGENRTDPSWN